MQMFGREKVFFFNFEYLSLSIKQKFELLLHLTDSERLLSVVVVEICFSADNI